MLLFSVNFMRRYQFNISIFRKLLVKFVAVIRLIADKPIRGILGKTTIYRCLNQLHFMGRSAFNMSGDRKTSSVCDGHDLGAFAALCLADSKTPFFAGTKVPSIKASRISMPPLSYRSLPIAGIACGMFGMADTLLVDLSRVRRFVKSIISRSSPHEDLVLFYLAGLLLELF